MPPEKVPAARNRTFLKDVPIQIVSRVSSIDQLLRTTGLPLSPGGWLRMTRLTPSELDAERERIEARQREVARAESAAVLGRAPIAQGSGA